MTKKKKNYMEGFILRMVRPSAHRLEPFCSHFGICGGCKWQPLPYEMQLQAKQQQVYDQLVRIGHLDVPEIQPIAGSEKTVGYRNKLEFTFSNRRWIEAGEDPESLSREDRVGLGFHVGRFFDKVLDIKKCYLQPEPSDAIRLFIRKYAVEHGLAFFDIRNHQGFLRNMIIRNNLKGDVMLILCFYHEDEKARTALLDAVAGEFPRIRSLWYVINGKANDSIADQECILYKGEDAIYEEMEGLRFKIGPKSFYQTNSLQACKLYGITREFADLHVPEAIADARINAANNGITNCEFFAGDMKDVLTDNFIAVHGKPDVIILDPPRAGIHPDVAKVILNAAPRRIVYVSCNPASQARDLAILCEKYRITAVRPVDMFPHTHHVENVVALEAVSE